MVGPVGILACTSPTAAAVLPTPSTLNPTLPVQVLIGFRSANAELAAAARAQAARDLTKHLLFMFSSRNVLHGAVSLCKCRHISRRVPASPPDRKSTRLNSSHLGIS